MQHKTHIANVLERNNYKDRYDTQAKQILSDKTVLSWILKYTTSEFKDYPIELIRTCIEGEPEVGSHRIFPSLAPDTSEEPGSSGLNPQNSKASPEAITGLDTVDKVPGEGEITYDVRFTVLTPTTERIKLIINVESQKKFNPGYDIVTRGIFYCTRMVAAQKETEFIGSDYDSIKKVYSIWISMENPPYAQHTITSYRMSEHPLYGSRQRKSVTICWNWFWFVWELRKQKTKETNCTVYWTPYSLRNWHRRKKNLSYITTIISKQLSNWKEGYVKCVT